MERQEEKRQLSRQREGFSFGAFGLTGAVGALWSAGRRLAVGAAAELAVVAGRAFLGGGCSGAGQHGAWWRYRGAHNNP